MSSGADDALPALARALNAARARWYLFGAQAAIFYGAARFTDDLDVTVFAPDGDWQSLARALDTAGFAIRIENADAFVTRTRVLPVVHVASGMPVDVVLAGPGLEELFVQRVVIHTVGGVSVPVARAEDIVAMKVLAGRPKDLEDALAVVLRQGESFDDGMVRAVLTSIEEALDRSDLLSQLDTILTRRTRLAGR